MYFEVEALPYAMDALEPFISKTTVEFHYDKHHKGYMKKLRALLENSVEASKPLETIVRESSGEVFNNAAQVHNHSFLWNSMKPHGGGPPPAGAVFDLLIRDFGSWDRFRARFIQSGVEHFGSGWVWLVVEAGHSKIVTTANAGTPLTTDAKPLLVVDVWEHAYYLDYQNRRETYLSQFCDKLINWDFVLSNLLP